MDISAIKETCSTQPDEASASTERGSEHLSDKRLELNTVRATCGGYLSKLPIVAGVKRSLELSQDIGEGIERNNAQRSSCI